MIGAKLHLKAIVCLPVWTYHDTGIRDEVVDLLLFFKNFVRTLSDRFEGCQVQSDDFNDPAGFRHGLLCRNVAFFHVTTKAQYFGTSSAEVLGSLLANTCVGT